MSNARNPLSALAFFAALGGIIYFAHQYGGGDSAQSSTSRPIRTDADESKPEFDGYDCAADCSGHKAGSNGPKNTASSAKEGNSNTRTGWCASRSRRICSS